MIASWLPSVKISVLLGALPIYLAYVCFAIFFSDASTWPALIAVLAANQYTALLLNWESPHWFALLAYNAAIRRYALPKDGWKPNAFFA